MTSRQNAYWTEQELTKLAKLVVGKVSYESAAKQLGRSVKAIKAMIDGNAGRKSYGFLRAALADAIAEHVRQSDQLKRSPALGGMFPTEPNFPPSKVTTIFPAEDVVKKQQPEMYRRPWSGFDEATLGRMFRQGESLEQMATLLKRTQSGILGRLAKLGFLKFNAEENAFFTVPVVYYRFE